MTDLDSNDAAGSAAAPGGWLRRWWWLVVGVVVALVAAIVIVMVVTSGDDDDDQPRADLNEGSLPSPPPTIGGDVDAEGQELLDLLDLGGERTYHAVYEVSGDPSVIGSGWRIEVWRQDGDVRQDMRQESEQGVVQASSFLVDDDIVACQRLDEGEWTCARQPPGDELTAAGTFGTIARELEGADVTVAAEEVAGRPARCFSVAGPSDLVSQCMSEEGIPLRRSGGGAELTLVELTEDVPAGTFTPPAEPATGG